MKRTWFMLFLALAMVSGAMPKRMTAQSPGSSCPLTDEPYCDYGPEPRFAGALNGRGVNKYRSRAHHVRLNAPWRFIMYGSVETPSSDGHYWDGYADYLEGLYPYDYYDDTAELTRETPADSLVVESRPAAKPTPERDEQHSPLYGLEAEAMAAGEYSPLYGLEEANAWAESRLAHDDTEELALDMRVRSGQSLESSDEQQVLQDDIAMGEQPEAGSDNYWDPVDPIAESDEVYQYEYNFDNYEYWYGDDNNAPAAPLVDSAPTYDRHFYEQYEAAVRPDYADDSEWLPPLEELPATTPDFVYDGYETVGGDDGYAPYDDSYAAQSEIDGAYEEPDSYGYGDFAETYPEEYDGYAEYDSYEPYGYEYDYGSRDESNEAWSSGIDDLYAHESDVNGEPEAGDDNWGEGDFYSTPMPADYESQWDGTAIASPQPVDDYWAQYEESWYEHNDRDFESDYEASNDYLDAADESTENSPSSGAQRTENASDYWEEFSDYVEPRVATAMEHGQYWYGEEEDWQAWEAESAPQFVPANSPLPESYWPEEYQPYDVDGLDEVSDESGNMSPMASSIIAPIWWAVGAARPIGDHWLGHVQAAAIQLRESLDAAERWLQSSADLAFEADWNCDRAWNAAERRQEYIR